jgi:hypothetical protein
MNKIACLSIVLILIYSCGDSITVTEQSEVKESAGAANYSSEKELNETLKEVKKEEELREKEELESLTTISFNETEHDYGNVKPESDNTAYFIVTNTGKKPLIIEKVEASCGCTTPEKPEKPILPGKTDKIKVVFHPKPGQVGEQNKTVTVTSNTEPRMALLKIKAFVK